MTSRTREFDWSATPLGAIHAWPRALRSTVDLLLPHAFAMVALWGPQLIQIYNDGYRVIMGNKHPAGLGQPTAECWPEFWHINEPIYARVLDGETLTIEDALYPIARRGPLEDAWFTLTYSPLRDDAGAIAGVLVTAFETTERPRANSRLADNEALLRVGLEGGSRETAFILNSAAAMTNAAGRITGGRVVERDVTSSRLAEHTLRASERQKTLLLELNDALRPLSEPHAIAATATRVLASKLGLSITFSVSASSTTHSGTLIATPPLAALSPEERPLAQAAFDRVSAEIERAHAEGLRTQHRRLATLAAEQETLRRALVLAEEKQRRELARDLHDEAGQHLAALNLGLQWLVDTAAPDGELRRRVVDLRALAGTLGENLHDVAYRLRPRALDDFGLASALEHYVEQWSHRSGIRAELHAPAVGERFSSIVETAVYRIVQEALTNVAMHSRAERAAIVMQRFDDDVQVVVEDDGRGFDPSQVDATRAGSGLGLLGMKERVDLLHGTLEIESSPGSGTTLVVRFPTRDRSDQR